VRFEVSRGAWEDEVDVVASRERRRLRRLSLCLRKLLVRLPEATVIASLALKNNAAKRGLTDLTASSGRRLLKD